MTPQAEINKLILIRDGYKNLDENGADEFRIIGKGVNATVEYGKTSYSEYVEALDIAIAAVEKQTPKKPIGSMKVFSKCPVCKNELYEEQKHCEECGQALDWSDNNDNT